MLLFPLFAQENVGQVVIRPKKKKKKKKKNKKKKKKKKKCSFVPCCTLR
jgi:hypothetical protein